MEQNDLLAVSIISYNTLWHFFRGEISFELLQVCFMQGWHHGTGRVHQPPGKPLLQTLLRQGARWEVPKMQKGALILFMGLSVRPSVRLKTTNSRIDTKPPQNVFSRITPLSAFSRNRTDDLYWKIVIFCESWFRCMRNYWNKASITGGIHF